MSKDWDWLVKCKSKWHFLKTNKNTNICVFGLDENQEQKHSKMTAWVNSHTNNFEN